MNVKKELENYRSTLARVKYLEVEIKKVKDRIEALEEELRKNDGLKETDQDIIEAMVLGRKIDGMPKGTGITDKTASTAINYKKVKEKLAKPKLKQPIYDELNRLRRIKEEYENELKEKKGVIDKLKAVVYALSSEEKFVIKKKYVEGFSYATIASLFEETFKKERTSVTMQNYRERGIEKMQKIIGE